MFDTHAHLQFSAFEGSVKEILERAHKAGVSQIIIPSTDVPTSKKAIEIASKFEHVFAAVGIHPHHIYQMVINKNIELKAQLQEIESLIENNKQSFSTNNVVAVGEVGMDYHYYKKTKYENYHVIDEFIELQKKALSAQMQFAIKHKKSLLLHNREAIDDFLEVLTDNWDKSLEGKTVFHCCEANERLLTFAIEHDVFIGVDGDVTYNKEKQEFVKKIPLDLLVLETDSPFLIPEPLRSQKIFPNQPSNLKIILEFLSTLLTIDSKELNKITTKNSRKLFRIQNSP